MKPAVYRVGELAELFDVSPWTIYESVKQGTCPVPPIRIGSRRLVWAKAPVDALLGIRADDGATGDKDESH